MAGKWRAWSEPAPALAPSRLSQAKRGFLSHHKIIRARPPKRNFQNGSWRPLPQTLSHIAQIYNKYFGSAMASSSNLLRQQGIPNARYIERIKAQSGTDRAKPCNSLPSISM